MVLSILPAQMNFDRLDRAEPQRKANLHTRFGPNPYDSERVKGDPALLL